MSPTDSLTDTPAPFTQETIKEEIYTLEMTIIELISSCSTTQQLEVDQKNQARTQHKTDDDSSREQVTQTMKALIDDETNAYLSSKFIERMIGANSNAKELHPEKVVKRFRLFTKNIILPKIISLTKANIDDLSDNIADNHPDKAAINELKTIKDAKHNRVEKNPIFRADQDKNALVDYDLLNVLTQLQKLLLWLASVEENINNTVDTEQHFNKEKEKEQFEIKRSLQIKHLLLTLQYPKKKNTQEKYTQENIADLTQFIRDLYFSCQSNHALANNALDHTGTLDQTTLAQTLSEILSQLDKHLSEGTPQTEHIMRQVQCILTALASGNYSSKHNISLNSSSPLPSAHYLSGSQRKLFFLKLTLCFLSVILFPLAIGMYLTYRKNKKIAQKEQPDRMESAHPDVGNLEVTRHVNQLNNVAKYISKSQSYTCLWNSTKQSSTKQTRDEMDTLGKSQLEKPGLDRPSGNDCGLERSELKEPKSKLEKPNRRIAFINQGKEAAPPRRTLPKYRPRSNSI